MCSAIAAWLSPPSPPVAAAVPVDPCWVDLGLPVLTLFRFDGSVRRAIIDWKEESDAQATRLVQGWYAEAIHTVFRHLPNLQVVTVPSSARTDRLRGERPLHDMVSRVLPPERLLPGLTAQRPRRDQAGLSRAERAANLQGAMAWVGAVPRALLVVDDVVTTGATMREAARAARAAGVLEVVGLALARRERPDPVAATGLGLC